MTKVATLEHLFAADPVFRADAIAAEARLIEQCPEYNAWLDELANYSQEELNSSMDFV